MAVPSQNYMLLKGGTDNGNSTIYTDDDSSVQNLIKIGDTLRISGTVDNNGVFTVTDITTDGTALGSTGDVYYSLKGAALTNESSAGSTDPRIEVIRAPGDKLIALGDVDSAGCIDIWSDNNTTTYSGTSPSTSGTGWTESAITPTLDGDNAKYIYHFADEALRVCNINESNTSIIKWYGYIQKQQFSNGLGLTFAEWQEHPNTLAPPKLAQGAYTYCYVNSDDVSGSGGTNTTLNSGMHDRTQATNYYSEYRGVAKAKVDSTSDLRFKTKTGKMTDMLGSAQKTFLGDALNDADSLLDFGGNNGDGGATLVDSDGFVVSNATFAVSSGIAALTNSSSAKGTAYLRLITKAGRKYQVNFDVAASSNCNGSVSFSSTTSYDTNNASGSISSGGAQNQTLVKHFTATSSSSYLFFRTESTTSSEHCDFDNVTVRLIDEIVFENTTPSDVLDQCTVGEVITVGEALGTYPKEALFCTKVSGGAGGPITYQRGYGGALVGTSPHVCLNTDTPILERGLGFNIGVGDGTDSGEWEAETYEVYQSFIYDSNQESLPFQMGDGDDGSNLSAGTYTATGGKSLRISVYADLVYNGRIHGARIYTRIKGTDDDLILLADIDIVKGVRTSIDGDHVSWTNLAGKGYYVIGDDTGNSNRPNLDTYTTINGFTPEIHFNAIGGRNEIYKASVVANRRAFIANVKIKGANIELQKYGDRIMYSEIGKFDTFLEHNFIDVSKGDYGEYTALESYADRLLAFKHNLVHIINISSPSISNWHLEETIKHFGVNYSFSVAKTNNGIAWVSDNGCYIYDGKNVKNLTDKKIAISKSSYTGTSIDWQSWYRGTAFNKDIILGYDPISNSLIMVRSPDDGSDYSNTGWIYDFDSNGWSYHSGIFTDSENYTNFITDWNNNLVLGYQNSLNITFQKFLPVSKSVADQEFVTKDIDFGEPGLIKKVYKVIVTYKSNESETTPFSYAVDGKQNFSGDGGGTFTGNFADTSDKWDVLTLTPSSVISCQSIQIKFDAPSAGIFEINDISIQYRIIRNKVVS